MNARTLHPLIISSTIRDDHRSLFSKFSPQPPEASNPLNPPTLAPCLGQVWRGPIKIRSLWLCKDYIGIKCNHMSYILNSEHPPQ